ncbi:hypothetical protein LOTGIDRAFT_175289 [Lottia gigantea]|uniref:Uncharacterized protein n=1 Tax=Lottia gigantea TaxID=225164 RepID=V4AJN9_LOTGI|nr:hypothetical protein LOTGIDRAFT_175289 [Lottia gigantea]ESO94920.1 hypothetical protein LOTGIDRAFT_175289 [Lottia gigantea]
MVMVEHKCPKGDSCNEARLEKVNRLLKSSQEDGVSAFGFSALMSCICSYVCILIWGILLCTALEVQVKVGSYGQNNGGKINSFHFLFFGCLLFFVLAFCCSLFSNWYFYNQEIKDSLLACGYVGLAFFLELGLEIWVDMNETVFTENISGCQDSFVQVN